MMQLHRLTGLTILAVCLSVSLSRAADTDTVPPPVSVRLARPTIGCGTYEDMKRIADAVISAAEGAEATTRSGSCRPFQILHGEIIERQPGAVCLLGLGNSRCIWVPEEAVEPARHL